MRLDFALGQRLRYQLTEEDEEMYIYNPNV